MPFAYREDHRNDVLALNIFVTWFLFVVLRPRPIVYLLGYWHVTLFSQPRGTPPPLDLAFGTFLAIDFPLYSANVFEGSTGRPPGISRLFGLESFKLPI